VLHGRNAGSRCDRKVDADSAQTNAGTPSGNAVRPAYHKRPQASASRSGSECDVEGARSASSDTSCGAAVRLRKIARDSDARELETSSPRIGQRDRLGTAGGANRLIWENERAGGKTGVGCAHQFVWT
jgi:hypothetical protein